MVNAEEMNSEFYHEMANKCHDQNSGHGKNHNEIFIIQYWIIMTLRSGNRIQSCNIVIWQPVY